LPGLGNSSPAHTNPRFAFFGSTALICVLAARAGGAESTPPLNSAAAAKWTPPLINQRRLNSPLVEVTPFVFQDRFYLLENWQKQWEFPGLPEGSRFQEDEVRLRDVEQDRIVATPLRGHGLGMAFVWRGRVNIFAGNWGQEKKWQITEIETTSSADLTNWTQPVVVLRAGPEEKFFNVSVCRGRDAFVLLVESNDPRWPAFTFKYFTSTNLTNWTPVPGALYGRDKYVGGPALYFEGDWYYTLYLESLGRNHCETRITRSRDLLAWQDAPAGRPFVTFNTNHTHLPLRPPQLHEQNASDAEVVYWKGKTLAYFTGSDQQLAGDLQVAEFNGPPRDLFESFYRAEGGANAGATPAAKTDNPGSPRDYLRRARRHSENREPAKAIADLDAAIKLDPRLADAWQSRGSEHFKLGHIKESIADFDQFLDLVPQQAPNHWQRGISLYYAGRFADGRKQFELHQTVNPNDVENAVWHFLCVARADGVEKARAALLPIQGDARVPMMEVHALFADKIKPEDVLEAAEAGRPTPAQLNRRLFYAHLYLGLYFEVLGDENQARENITLAAGRYRTDDYMGDVARVHRQLRWPKEKTSANESKSL